MNEQFRVIDTKNNNQQESYRVKLEHVRKKIELLKTDFVGKEQV